MEVPIKIFTFNSSALTEVSFLNNQIRLALIFLKLLLNVFRLRQNAVWIVLVIIVRQYVLILFIH